MRTTQIVLGIVVAIVLAGGGFAAGLTVGRGGATASASASASASGAARRVTGSGAPGALGGGGVVGPLGGQAVVGRILSVNDGSITIETRQGGGQGASPSVGSQIVLVGANTRLVRTVEQDIKLADLKQNDQVTIVGTADQSGTLSATAIIVGGNALQQLFGGQGGAQLGGGRAPASASPTARP